MRADQETRTRSPPVPYHPSMNSDQPDLAPRRSPRRYLRALSHRPSLARLQFGGPETAASAEELADPHVRQEYLDRLSRAFARADRDEKPPNAGVQQERSAVLRHADVAMVKLGRDGAEAALDRDDRVGLEAVIRLSGRPSILIKDGDLDLDSTDPDLGPWQGTILLARDGMKHTIRSVGRIDRSGFHIGTGFVVAPGLVMTNRHVLQAIAHEAASSNGTGRWTMLGGTSTIDFAVEYGSTRTSQFTITGVTFCGPTPIGNTLDVAKLDLALLSVEPANSAGDELPEPLPLTRNPAAGRQMGEVYMVGYPARPSALPSGRGAEDGQLVDTLKRIFRMRYGYKRLALGSITHPLGQVPNDPVPWAIGHDATTLGGNSGSCVVGLSEEGTVLGLHFGGIYFDHNLAHVFAAVPALQASPATTLGLAWR
jgi:serine protease